MREILNFNNGWKFIQKNIDPSNYLKEKFKKVVLPHTWNNLDGQDGGADYYRGSCWYLKNFGKIDARKNDVVYLEFEGVQSICDVYLNGKHICHHEGGFSTFRVRIDELLEKKNTLLVKADNSSNDRIYPQMADFTFFGGIYRNVNIIVTNKVHFDLDYYGGPGVTITPVLVDGKANITVESYVTNHSDELISIDVFNAANEIVYTATSKELKHEFVIENPHLWNGVKDPYLYTANISIIKEDNILDDKTIQFGIRTFSFDAQKGFYLNGVLTPLRGVSRHQDRYNMGWAITKKEHEEDMKLIQEVGANTIRLAHYQHDQYFYSLCDKAGMVVWAEIPWISSHMVNGNDNVVSQMKELVIQNYNHPSILMWGLSNEITISGETEDLLKRHYELNEIVHNLDKTRVTTMAQVSPLDIHSEMNKISDIISYNHYFGWYGGDFTDNDEWLDNFHKEYPNRVIGISEYGCEAILTWHNSNPQQGDYSEEYQCMYHHHMLEVFAARPWIWGTHVWNMFDFAADARDEGGCKGRNNKGLVTYDRKIKKDSFYLYQAYWTTKPMLHIASKRYIYRTDDVTKVVVYSNNPEVSLYVNNVLLETKKGNKVFEFEVKLGKGKTKLKAVSNGLVDNSYIVKVKETYKGYSFDNDSAGVTNWFDADGKEINMTFNRDYFSIKDKIKDIMENPEGKQVIDKFINKAIESFGGEAAGFKITPGMIKMMMSFSIERLSKMAGDKFTPEMAASINEELQKIKK